MRVRFNNIPAELKDLRQWVCVRGGSKAPMNAEEIAPASSTDPKTWSPFLSAKNCCELGIYDYPGFVFNDNGLVGIDIDTGYDEEGYLSDTAYDIISRCRSYTERSRSGRGFHVIVRGDLPFKGKNNLQGVEIYKAARYFIMTGNVVEYHRIEENQDAIDYVIDTYFPMLREAKEGPAGPRIYSPIWQDADAGRIQVRPVYPLITPGSRNLCLTSLAGMLHNLGYTPQQIYDELSYANQAACVPALTDREVVSICRSVSRYAR